jgi:hypothetical protein
MLNRVLMSFLCLILFINYLPLNYAHAEVDNQIPVVESVNVTPLEAKVGDIITVKAKIIDSSGVEASKVEFKTPSNFSRGIWLYYNSTSGLWEGTYQVKSTDEPGTWTSSFMYLSDNAGNYGSINPSLMLTVHNTGAADNQIPVVESVNVTPLEAEVGDIITVKAQISDSSGVEAAKVEFKTPSNFSRGIWLYYNSTSIGKGKADTRGTFSIAVPVQKAGTVIRVIVRDGGGNNSPYTSVTVLDKTAPIAPKINAISDKDTVVTGTAEANVTVYVKVGSTTIGKRKADAIGKFSIAVPVQKAGTIVRVITRDSGGNNSPYTSVSVQDKTTPIAPKVNAITNRDTVVTGTAEANVTVYVKVGTTTIGKGKVDSTGKFSVAVPVQKAGTEVRVIVRDSGGNNSPYTVMLVNN